MNKKKIFNDPVWGFISVNNPLIFDIIEHPFFQRLRRIKQLGLAELVYPGALHTRFHHALGAYHLMGEALLNLKSKGHQISDSEFEAAQIAILLHDIGHGPFSHVLENTILDNIHHESISLILMQKINMEMDGKLTLAIKMFNNKYHRGFFHQLISSQLDIDRLDYLSRDCFFTGVTEGNIGADRLIKMMDIVDNKLVIEEKGIYSIENFLTARRLMYWQVYLHKSSICAETMLINIIKRAKYLISIGQKVNAPASLYCFLSENVNKVRFQENPIYVDAFAKLDDLDIWTCIKEWSSHEDKLLATLSNLLLNRKLFKIILSNSPISQEVISETKATLESAPNYNKDFLPHLFIEGCTTNSAYISGKKQILIKTKNRGLIDIADASDLPTIKALSKIVKKYYLCWAKNVTL